MAVVAEEGVDMIDEIEFSDDDDDSDGWSEEPDANESHSVKCLFCAEMFKSTEEAIVHCKVQHKFDLLNLKKRFDMDCYSFIKMVNYIRQHDVKPEAVMGSSKPPWEADDYLKPFDPNDPWLLYDLDDLEPSCSTPHTTTGGFHLVNAEDGCVTLSQQHFAELRAKLHDKDEEVRTLRAALSNLREAAQRLVGGEEHLERHVATLTVHNDQSYFSSYGHWAIHHEMLLDSVRTSSYHRALTENAPSISGRSVLDLGCGTAVLSMFAAAAGARPVVAIDQADIIYHAMDIIRENGLADVVTLVKGRIEDTHLPHEHFDVIVSEWMGYFLLFEAMLDSVVYARDHHLAPGGLLVPNRCSLSLVGVADPERHQHLLGFWDDVYGFKMSCLRGEVLREPNVEVVPPERIATLPATLLELDLHTCTADSVNFSAPFKLEATRTDTLTALAGYFDVMFDLPVAVAFSTSPHATPTHWKQTVFLLKEPLHVQKGEVLTGKLICQRHQKEVRSLTVTIIIGEKKSIFNFS